MKPSARHPVLALLAIALAAVVGPVSQADAASPSLGLVTVETPTAPELQQMAAAGTDAVKVNVFWETVEPAQGIRDWSFHDALIGDVARAGMMPLALVFGSPRWLYPNPARPPIYTPEAREAWSRFLTDFAARYGPEGFFWQLHPEIPYKPVADWEIWNEANLNGFWDGKPDPAGFALLLQISNAALKSVDPSARTIAGGLFPEPRRGFGVSMLKYLDRFYRVPGVRESFDDIAIHPYAEDAEDVLQTMRDVRRLISRKKDSAPLWITEVGWATSGKGLSVTPFRASEKGQARLLGRSYRLLISNSARLGLEGVFWHIWRDVDEPGADLWPVRMGLLRSNGSPKPAFRAYARIAR